MMIKNVTVNCKIFKKSERKVLRLAKSLSIFVGMKYLLI